jgi:Zn-dependent peptidase ImmA (M78 family)
MLSTVTSTQKGDALERLIHDLFQTQIHADRFWVKKENCKIFLKKGYYSKDRQGEIIFDVAIEIYLPDAEEYSFLVLIECKNYAHSVPVDDVEEFFTKVQQVAAANAKAIVASTASFQSGARTFATSKGIGLIRYFAADDFKWELKRSPSATARSNSADEAYDVEIALAQEEFRSFAFDLYMQSPARKTNSLWDFFEDLMLDSGFSSHQVRRIANSRSKLKNQVPFHEKDSLESLSFQTLAELGYSSGEVDLIELSLRQSKLTGLTLETDVVAPVSDTAHPVLGRITFEPLLIQIYAQETQNRGRERFTLAHELAHHLLNHGAYLVSETCDDSDFSLQRSKDVNGSDIARMEFQANYLAASLLMPRTNFIEDFYILIKKLDVPNKGFGSLYVDDQPCNLQTFQVLTGLLMQRYGVSREAAKIRLESLGLLRDARARPSAVAVQNVFASIYNN